MSSSNMQEFLYLFFFSLVLFLFFFSFILYLSYFSSSYSIYMFSPSSFFLSFSSYPRSSHFLLHSLSASSFSSSILYHHIFFFTFYLLSYHFYPLSLQFLLYPLSPPIPLHLSTRHRFSTRIRRGIFWCFRRGMDLPAISAILPWSTP